MHLAFKELRIYLTIPVNNCEGERSFSTLARVKSHFTSIMSQERLVSLTIISIESDLLSSIDFDNLIDEFAATKTRKRIV